MSPTAVTLLLNGQPAADLMLPDDVPSQLVATALAEKYVASCDPRTLWSLGVGETLFEAAQSSKLIAPSASLAESAVLNGCFCTLQGQPLGSDAVAMLVSPSGVRFKLGDQTVIGRIEQASRNTVDIDLLSLAVERVISRKHAVITHVDSNYSLEDFSKHGTWVNGNKIAAPRLLRANDVIIFGPPDRGATLIFQIL